LQASSHIASIVWVYESPSFHWRGHCLLHFLAIAVEDVLVESDPLGSRSSLGRIDNNIHNNKKGYGKSNTCTKISYIIIFITPIIQNYLSNKFCIISMYEIYLTLKNGIVWVQFNLKNFLICKILSLFLHKSYHCFYVNLIIVSMYACALS